MLRLFYGPEPFFHFGPESVPVYYLTGICLFTCVGPSSYQHVNKNIFPPLQKNDTEHIHRTQHHQQQERTLAIQLLHHEYGAPQHHPSMPPTKATGGIKKTPWTPHRNTIVNVGVLVVRFGRGRERRHRFMGCVFWEKFGRRGV
jgi:hypothetical protein